MDDQPKPFADEAEWRNTLPFEMQHIAEKWGRVKFAIAWNIGSINEACMVLNKRTKGNMELTRAMFALTSSMDQLTGMLLDEKEMSYEIVREIQREVEITVALASAQKPASKLILPH